MSLARLRRDGKPSASRVVGIDCSTQSLAVSLFHDKKLVKAGEVMFTGSTVFGRLVDASVKTAAIYGELQPDFVAIEAAVMVRSAAVGIKLAYVYGAVIAELGKHGAAVVEVPPITWQSYIGNKTLSTAEKAALKKEFPDKSTSWYQNKGRELRKQRTLDFARTLGLPVHTNSDNVGDAIGVGWYATNHLTK